MYRYSPYTHKEKKKKKQLCDKNVPANKFPWLMHHTQMIIALFGSTYLCEQLFNKLIFIKSKMWNKLTDAHLEGTLRVAGTHLQPDVGVVEVSPALDCTLNKQ